MIFLRAGAGPEDLAGELIHEATHRVGKANKFRGNDFMSEAVAEFAERDFYMTLYADRRSAGRAGAEVEADPAVPELERRAADARTSRCATSRPRRTWTR